ncbi:hypothetical protein LUZ60_015114 [Juncus effusus]|nr:hypothetical protein LUZ60_015114 [Juncus effusus]
METRNRVMKATLGFFALPNEPSNIVDPLISNLITLLCTILLTSGEDGRSRAEQLLHILRQIDPFVSSNLEHQRRRGCVAVLELLTKFRSIFSGSDRRNFSTLPSAFVLPNRDALFLGERIIAYLPRCADTNTEVRKISVQIVALFFTISLSLPKLKAPGNELDLEASYSALTSLEDVISILRSDASIDQSEVFHRVVSSVSVMLTKDEMTILLHSCTSAVCDKIKQSADGAVHAVIEFISKRGKELNENDISRTTQSLLSAAISVTDKHSRQEVLTAISCLAENTNSNVVFDEVLTAAGKDIITKDVTRIRGGWALQDTFYAFSQHAVLATQFLEYIISVINKTSALKSEGEKGESNISESSLGDNTLLQAAVLSLTAFFRGGEKVGKRAVEQNYSSVLSALVLKLGSLHGLSVPSQQEHLKPLLTAFQSFCDCMADLEMGKILARDGELTDKEKWIDLVQEIACCTALKRPKEVSPTCTILSKALNKNQRFEREASAAALSEFISHCDSAPALLEQMVEELCLHVSDESPTVRSLCLRGLVQIPESQMSKYVAQVLGVIVALLEDPDESVQLTAVQCLLKVLNPSAKEAVDPIMINLSVRLRNLQVSMDSKMRANAFAAYGALSTYGPGSQHQAFLEQVHATLPRLILHLHDDDISVRLACRKTFKELAPLMEIEGLRTLLNKHYFSSDRRSDYEDFIRDLTRLLCQLSAARVDSYLEATIQAFEAPWPLIKANAISFSSCMLALLHEQRSFAPYFSQVFTILVAKMCRSADPVVRSASNSALGLLIKTVNPLKSYTPHLDRIDSFRSSQDTTTHPVSKPPAQQQNGSGSDPGEHVELRDVDSKAE